MTVTRRGLAVHASILAAVLVLGLLLVERDVGFTPDEGGYALGAETIADGSWTTDWRFAEVDPTGRHLPSGEGEFLSNGKYLPQARQLAWPAALGGAERFAPGSLVVRLLSLVSVIVGACVAWALARRLGAPRAAPWAFWITVSSPLLPNGYMLWAHAPETALAGIAALAVVVLLDEERSTWWWTLALVAAATGGAAIRSEGVLYAVALGGVLGLVGLVRRSRRLVISAVLAGAAAAAAVLADEALYSSIVGGGPGHQGIESRDRGGAWLDGRLNGTGRVLIEGALDSRPANVLMVLALGLVVLAVVSLRGEPASRAPSRVTAGFLLAAAAVLMVRIVVAPDDPAAGVLVAWPVCAFAALALRGARSTGAKVMIASSGLFVIGVLLTQYDNGGGTQWGARYLSPIVVPVAVLAAVVISDRVERRSIAGALVAVLAVTGVGGWFITDQFRRDNADAIASIDRSGADVVLISEDGYRARFDWQAWSDRQWVAANGDLAGALDVLRRAGVTQATAIEVPPGELEAAGAVLGEIVDQAPLVQRFTVGPTSRRADPPPAQGPISNVRSQVVAPG